MVKKGVPYFAAKQLRQRYGFEGPDLEISARLKIQDRAKSIPRDDITLIEGQENLFYVRSQSAPGRYRIDIEAYTCECNGYPLISFCKHLAAVQIHFPEKGQTRPFATTFSISANLPLTPGGPLSAPTLSDPVVEPCDNGLNDGNTTAIDFRDLEEITDLCNRLQQLAVCARFSPPQKLTPPLRNLYLAVQDAFSEFEQPVVPLPKKIAPNQRSAWSETAKVMGAQVKTKKRKHTDPYAGGERPGKKAKPDARR